MLQSRSRFPVVTSAATDLRPQRLVLTSCYRLSLAALSPRLTCADAEPPWGDRVAVEAAKRDLAGVSQLGDICIRTPPYSPTACFQPGSQPWHGGEQLMTYRPGSRQRRPGGFRQQASGRLPAERHNSYSP
jgi:hypothetical protein